MGKKKIEGGAAERIRRLREITWGAAYAPGRHLARYYFFKHADDMRVRNASFGNSPLAQRETGGRRVVTPHTHDTILPDDVNL